MIPVPGLDSVRCAWIDIRAAQFSLHGFLVYLSSDQFFPEYIDGAGLSDLDVWSGSNCAIFVIQVPSVKWIMYAKQTNHIWWRIFGPQISSDRDFEDIVSEYGEKKIFELDGKLHTLRDIFAPSLNDLLHNNEIAKILERFNLPPTGHPGLILFRDLEDSEIWHIDMSDLVDLPEKKLRQAMRAWFAGKQFSKLLKDATNAKN